MSDEASTSRLERVFANVFQGKLTFSPDLKRDNQPSWDSLKHIELLVALEQEFAVRLDGADATEMTSVEKILQVLGQKLHTS